MARNPKVMLDAGVSAAALDAASGPAPSLDRDVVQPGPARPDSGGPAVVAADDAALVRVPGAESAGALGEAALGATAPVIPMPAGGPGVGADRIAEPELATRSVALDPRTADPRGPAAGDGYGSRYATGYQDDRAPAAGPATRTVVDPDGIPGTHVFEALTNIQRDGRTYGPGEEIELDFRGYEELVAIGAVPPIDWRTGDRIRIAPTPGAARY